MTTTTKVNRLFYFNHKIPLDDKLKIIRDTLRYISRNKGKVDDIRFTSGIPFDGIYIINNKEVDADIKRNKENKL